jgi:cyanate permease
MTTPVSMMFAGETFAAAGTGVAVGFASTTGQLASSASGPFFGYTLDVTGSFSVMWGVALGCVLVSMLCLITVKERKWDGPAAGKH